jgi:hypothetical protein
MPTDYVAPGTSLDAFNCPHCGAYAKQDWCRRIIAYRDDGQNYQLTNWSACICQHCDGWGVWLEDQLVYPAELTAPLPHQDMPEDVRRDYAEARNVGSHSNRAAAALLRLAIERLCYDLCEKRSHEVKDLDSAIAALVRDGLPKRVQKALDAVRVIGNNSVHPGQMDISDDPSMALSLFSLVNMIVEKMITEPKELDQLYEALPEGARAHIDQRDAASADETST